MDKAPETGTYKATEEGFHFRHYAEGQTDHFKEGEDLPHYFKLVRTTSGAPTTVEEPQLTNQQATEPEAPDDDKVIRALAKEMGISSWHVKGIDKLKSEIATKQAEIADAREA